MVDRKLLKVFVTADVSFDKLAGVFTTLDKMLTEADVEVWAYGPHEFMSTIKLWGRERSMDVFDFVVEFKLEKQEIGIVSLNKLYAQILPDTAIYFSNRNVGNVPAHLRSFVTKARGNGVPCIRVYNDRRTGALEFRYVNRP